MTGLVRRPLTPSLADLRERFTHHEVAATLQCAGNRRAGLLEVDAEPSDNYFQATAFRLLAAGEEPAPGLGLALGPVALSSSVLEPAAGARWPPATSR